MPLGRAVHGASRDNIVRAPDGVHFCPDGKTTLVGGFEECDVYSSGAFRFASGDARARPHRAISPFGALGLHYRRAELNPPM